MLISLIFSALLSIEPPPNCTFSTGHSLYAQEITLKQPIYAILYGTVDRPGVCNQNNGYFDGELDSFNSSDTIRLPYLIKAMSGSSYGYQFLPAGTTLHIREKVTKTTETPPEFYILETRMEGEERSMRYILSSEALRSIDQFPQNNKFLSLLENLKHNSRVPVDITLGAAIKRFAISKPQKEKNTLNPLAHYGWESHVQPLLEYSEGIAILEPTEYEVYNMRARACVNTTGLTYLHALEKKLHLHWGRPSDRNDIHYSPVKAEPSLCDKGKYYTFSSNSSQNTQNEIAKPEKAQ